MTGGVKRIIRIYSAYRGIKEDIKELEILSQRYGKQEELKKIKAQFYQIIRISRTGKHDTTYES